MRGTFTQCAMAFLEKSDQKLIFDRARWGGSGALFLQTAIAGLNSSPRLIFCRVCFLQVAMKIGSYATETCESRQVRKEAAVSSYFRVP